MTIVLQRYLAQSRRLRRQAEKSHQRLDIQGLRMVAVLTVLGNHLWGWPGGGFVGVDVFFVISGYLITGNLLRMADKSGNISFRKFYWNRIRRIIPAATLVLLLTVIAAYLIFASFRAQQVGIDALFAFIFMSNWWFASNQTDYFASGDAVSPIQHYWSLSIEEQFYFVWPALIFAIGLVVARRAWPNAHRLRLAGAVMGGVVVMSLIWALHETITSPISAYFNTFGRAWELGAGALLATMGSTLARIPTWMKPWLSWSGLALIGIALILIHEGALGFPAPWAIVPVAGSAMVIAAGVNGEPTQQALLRNPISVYVGNISYSLYLVHWPVIVFLGTLMPGGAQFYIAAATLSFALAILSFHFVENPLRYAEWRKLRDGVRDLRRRRYQPQLATKYAAFGALILITATLWAYSERPAIHSQAPPPIAAVSPATGSQSPGGNDSGPLLSALQVDIAHALTATEWPPLNPSMEEAMFAPESPPEVHECNGADPSTSQCKWGSPTAPVRMLIVGDSIALSYAGVLQKVAVASQGQIQLSIATMGGCQFADSLIFTADRSVVEACDEMKQRTIDFINSTKPDVVLISNAYGSKPLADNERVMGPRDWASSLRQIIARFQASAKKIVLLSAPPADKNIRECYGARISKPADCISEVNDTWRSLARAERDLAQSIGATWIDSRPWFCNDNRFCPSFVGSTPVKRDTGHMSYFYGEKIAPVVGETLHAAGVI